MAMLESIVGVVVLMLLIVIILILFACKPWRLLSRFRSRSGKVGDLQRPLVSKEGDPILDQNIESGREYDLEGAYQNEGLSRPSRTKGLVHKQRLPSSSPHLNQGDSLVLDIVPEPSEEIPLGQTLKLPQSKDYLPEVRKYDGRHDQRPSLRSGLGNESFKELSPKVIKDQRSCLSIEVISGPSSGLHYSVLSTSGSKLPVTLGRVSPSELTLKDSEVSGKHALIDWNVNKLKWELVDMGSLNGTLLNSQPVNHPDSGSRHWGDPVELASGDVITLGTTSKVLISIASQDDYCMPFGIGVASDPMALRRGGKKLPMEDVYYYQWPLPGVDKFGLFGVCDGHGGSGAALSASKILPKMVTDILSDSMKRKKILSQCDASDVLRDAFSETEACMDHYYEGCTATLLLVWSDGDGNFFAQCANVGDSACLISVDGKQIKMTEDHRVISPSERMRFQETGEPLRDGETRLCGLNLSRMLGDKFLKQQDTRFSSEPYVSQVAHIDQASGGFALMASDGFWDVISVKKAVQLVLQLRERVAPETENQAEKIANGLLNEARALRTKDNTSIIFLDFDRVPKKSCCKFHS